MRSLACLVVLSFANPMFAAEPTVYRAGVAAVKITPREPIWMAGYASRNKPADGTIHDLYAKALCLDDGRKSLVLLTSDLIGLPRTLADAVAADVKTQTGLTRDCLMLTASHTHSGPVLRDNLADMYDLSPAEAKKISDYNATLKDLLVGVIVKAYQNRVPAILSHGEGDAGFAINRRQATAKGVQIGLNPDGSVDHRVPVLKVESADRTKLLAVAFGYACHNTTLDLYQWSGDYAGFAQAELEKTHPGTVAMFWTGCGADANPTPRRLQEHAVKHGQSLATSVNAVLKSPMTALTGNLQSQYETIRLDFAAMPTRDQLKADTKSTSFAHRTRAKRLLIDWEKNGSIADHYPHYPVQVWRLGTDLVWVALGGEVVVDYALRLRHELKGQGHLWVAGYANDVMAYIPSARVLHEGGYEADSSMVYYGMPSRWALNTEDRIIEATKRLMKAMK